MDHGGAQDEDVEVDDDRLKYTFNETWPAFEDEVSAIIDKIPDDVWQRLVQARQQAEAEE